MTKFNVQLGVDGRCGDSGRDIDGDERVALSPPTCLVADTGDFADFDMLLLVARSGSGPLSVKVRELTFPSAYSFYLTFP